MAENVSPVYKCILNYMVRIEDDPILNTQQNQLINYPNKLKLQLSLHVSWSLSLSLIHHSQLVCVLMDAAVCILCALKLQHFVIISRRRRWKREKEN